MEGGCTCGNIRYRLTGKPLVVNACHCTWCQRETGTVHALNAVYEFDHVEHLKAEPEIVDTPSASGKGQKIARCPDLQGCDLEQLSRLRPAAALRPRRHHGRSDAVPAAMPTSSRPPSSPG